MMFGRYETGDIEPFFISEVAVVAAGGLDPIKRLEEDVILRDHPAARFFWTASYDKNKQTYRLSATWLVLYLSEIAFDKDDCE